MKFGPSGPTDNNPSLALNRRQAIIYDIMNNDGLIHWRIHASLVLVELNTNMYTPLEKDIYGPLTFYRSANVGKMGHKVSIRVKADSDSDGLRQNLFNINRYRYHIRFT